MVEKKTIFVSGSLAYDRIMNFPGKFSDHILPEKIHIINVSFIVDGMTEKFGGTAGNIAYALALLGERPIILATIGRDYQRYFEWLEKNHIDTDSIRIIQDEFTAGAFITTDAMDNQITGFNPGAMKYPSSYNFEQMYPKESIAVVAPGNQEDMIKYPRIYKEKGIEYIFDPGQAIPALGPKELEKGIRGSKILISNDYELEMITKKTGLDRKRLLELTGIIITTRGELGSVVYLRDGEISIPAVKSRQVVDPTGAGDAYRAGLLKGLVQGKDIRYCALMGAVCASFAVECHGTQEYSFTPDEFQKRFEESSR